MSGFDPAAFADREKLRAELGYAPGEQVCIVTVGGSGVGGHLLRRVVEAFPEAKELVPELRMVVVAGPRIDPAAFPEADGLEVRAYVHNLYRHLAACDLAVVQGGLTTSMELTANRRPFLYFPLRHHFEQNFHVRHRLGRYGAGRAMDFETATPAVIAQAIAEEIGREVDYAPGGDGRRGEGGREDRRAPLMAADEDAIVRCVLDYFEGWFEADPERMRRALHPDLAKRSLGREGLDQVTASQMVDETAAGAGRKRDSPARRIDVHVVEVYGDIATVVVDSNVYREYVHLVRTDGDWKIVNALWAFT